MRVYTPPMTKTRMRTIQLLSFLEFMWKFLIMLSLWVLVAVY